MFRKLVVLRKKSGRVSEQEELREDGRKGTEGRRKERRSAGPRREKQQLQHPIRIASGPGRGGEYARQGHSREIIIICIGRFVRPRGSSGAVGRGRARSGAWHACRAPHYLPTAARRPIAALPGSRRCATLGCLVCYGRATLPARKLGHYAFERTRKTFGDQSRARICTR